MISENYTQPDPASESERTKGNADKVMVSLIIPCYNEERYIRTVLDNILQQDYSHEHLQVIIADGMSTDQTRSIVNTYEQKYGFIHMVDNERRFVPYALNKGISSATGEVIMIMGAHSVYPANYISVLVQALIDLKADNVGALCETRPSSSTRVACAISKVVSSPFGVGNAHFRIGASKRMKVDTVTFGCYRREVFEKIGMFDEELLRNQDDEFNTRLIENGGSIYLIPEVRVVYFSREHPQSLFRMYFQYGLFKPLVSLKIGKPSTIRQLIPFGFVLFILAGFPLSFLTPAFLILYLSGWGLYLLANLLFSLKISIENNDYTLMLYLPWLFFILHFSYGTGYISGLVNFVFLKRKRTQILSSR